MTRKAKRVSKFWSITPLSCGCRHLSIERKWLLARISPKVRAGLTAAWGNAQRVSARKSMLGLRSNGSLLAPRQRNNCRACRVDLSIQATGKISMDRRSFLTGVVGVAGAAAMVAVARVQSVSAGVPPKAGILGELDASDGEVWEPGSEEALPIDHRRWHRYDEPWGGRHRRWDRRHRRWDRRGGRWRWRRVCRHYWYRGRRRYRCYRRRVWGGGW